MKQIDIDKKLKIETDQIDEYEDIHHNRYEPTPYEVLDRLIESGYITKDNHVIDFGCGKGRVALYLNHKIGCQATGIDYNQELIDVANQNKKNLNSSVEFKCMNAEDVMIKDEDRFYFFNPFSDKILRSVLSNILDSYYQDYRSITLFFYYPEDDVMATMMGYDEFICSDCIECSDLYEKYDEREKIVIFETI